MLSAETVIFVEEIFVLGMGLGQRVENGGGRALGSFVGRVRAFRDLVDRRGDAHAILNEVELRIHAAVEIAQRAVGEAHAADMAGAAAQRGEIRRAARLRAREAGEAEPARDRIAGLALVDEQPDDIKKIRLAAPLFRREPRQQLQNEIGDAAGDAEGKIGEPAIGDRILGQIGLDHGVARLAPRAPVRRGGGGGRGRRDGSAAVALRVGGGGNDERQQQGETGGAAHGGFPHFG